MRKIAVALYILFILLMISACTTGDGNKAKLEKDLYKGTEGVTLDLYQDKLPSEVYEGEVFSYVVKITNKGPYPVNKAKFIISLEKGYMGYNGQSPSTQNIIEIGGINLDGKSIFNTFDDFDVREFSIKANNIEGQSEYHNSVITTDFCYDYQGIALTNVCIDTDPYSTRPGQKACTVQDSISLSSGQGGPVAITDVETRMLIDNTNGGESIKPQFIIHVANQGTGFVTKPGVVDSVCSNSPLSNDVYNTVSLNNIKLSRFTKKDFDCYPDALVLTQDQDKITCILKPGLISKATQAFITPLEIDISYGYMYSISKEIKIKKILKY